MDYSEVIVLLKKYKEGTLSDHEKAMLESWYIHYASKGNPPHLSEEQLMEGLVNIENNLPLKNKKNSFKTWIRISAAAFLLVSFSFSVYFFQTKFKNNDNTSLAVRQDVSPGSNKAVLTLADGTQVNLNDDQEGIVIGKDIIKYNDGSSVSHPNPHALQGSEEPSSALLTLTTPKGGQYQITLPDGTKVWLNAASTLKYPSRFSRNERRVELEGEAYFEVAPVGMRNSNSALEGSPLPFFVSSAQQDVKVLGTHFNINAYANELSTKTTLLEGSVEVSAIANSHWQLLSPGQQAILNNNKFQVKNINVDYEIAWKEGIFRFKEESLESIMRKIARWYSVDVDFKEESLKKETFVGVISKYSQASEVLKMLEMAGDARFSIIDNTIIVQKK